MEKVALVLGNHDFFDLTCEEAISTAKQLSQEPPLKSELVLAVYTGTYHIWRNESSGSIIMDCTLWSFVAHSAKAIVESKISDYKKIGGWSVEKNNQRHTGEAAWLDSELQSLSNTAKTVMDPHQHGRDILVVTHHAPSLMTISAPQHVRNPWTPAFATNLLPRLNTERVKTWVFSKSSQ